MQAWEQQSLFMRQPAPRGWHVVPGCGLVAPGSTFVVFDELKQAIGMSPRTTSANQRETRSMGDERRKTGTKLARPCW
jgi:hypothetical protein